MILDARVVVQFTIAVLLFGTFAYAQDEVDVLRGRLELPPNVSGDQIQLILHENTFTEVEDDWQPVARFNADAEGNFTIEYDATENTEIEIAGPGVRRARFAWPSELANNEEQLAVFGLDPGGVLRGDIADALTGETIGGALIGPIVPGEDAPARAGDVVFPFYTRSQADGKIIIAGVLPNISYYVNIHADGYIRRRIKIEPHSPFSVRLMKGGEAVTGQVVGAKTFTPRGDTAVLITGGPESFYLMRTSDAEGKFVFNNMPEGQYELVPFIPSIGSVRPTEVTVVANQPIPEIVLYVPEGIEVSGTVVDAETDLPIAEARLQIRDAAVLTNENGEYIFPKVEGPWPVSIEFEHPAYNFELDDQNSEVYPIGGYGDLDVKNLTLKARRKRFLEIVRTEAEDQPLLPAVLEVWGPLEDSKAEVKRHRVDGRVVVAPIESAGTRVALARAIDNMSSDLYVVKTAVDQTTTTVQVALQPGAMIEGSLTYEAEDPPAAPPFQAILTTSANGEALEPLRILSVRPDAEGKFQFDSLPPGDFDLRFVRPEGEPYMVEQVKLVRGETVEMHRTVLRGKVLAGMVVDHEENPLSQITISAYGVDPSGAALHLKTVTKDDGTFQFEDFGGDAINQLSISHYHHAPYQLSDLPLPQEDFVIRLEPRAGLEVVVNTSEELLHDAEVFLLNGRQVASGDGSVQWFYDVIAREPMAGNSSVTIVPRFEGHLRVAVRAGGAWDVSQAVDWRSSMTGAKVEMTPDHSASITVSIPGIDSIEEMATVDLMLLNTSLPEEMTQVEFQPAATADERFLFDMLPPGVYMLVGYDAQGGASTITNIELSRGQSQSLELDLSPPSQELVGLVLAGRQRELVGGAQVVLRFGDIAEAQPLIETVTSQAGTFRLSPLPAGRPFLVDVIHNGQSRRFSVAAKPEATTIHEEFHLQSPQLVNLVAPDALRSRMESQPQVPLLLQNSGGPMQMLRLGDLASAQELLPGNYFVFWGENRIGPMTVPSSAETIEVVLPDIQ